MTEEESLASRFKNVITSLQKIAECPICLETVRVPFKICGRGHGVCSSCCINLKKCPTCEALFALENPIFLKNILEALPYLCRYSDEGCDEILKKGSEHELYCGYRPMTCRKIGCSVVVPLNKIMNHYNKDHPSQYIYQTALFVVTWYNFDLRACRYDYVPISLFNNIFWIFIINDIKDKCLKLYFEIAPIGEMRNDYFAQIRFEKENFVFTSTVKSSVLTLCERKSPDSSGINELNNIAVGGQQREETEFMAIPHSSLQNLFYNDEDCKLKCEFFIFEKGL